jgi:hypothetical protein
MLTLSLKIFNHSPKWSAGKLKAGEILSQGDRC